MGRAPCCDKASVKKGPWSPEEDRKLKEYIQKHGTGGNWIALPHKAGLKRCGKSCRLRWLNYLRPNIKHGDFSEDEDRIICSLFATIGSRWSIIAAQLPGRTDNDIKNYWNTKLKKKLMLAYGLQPPTTTNGLHHRSKKQQQQQQQQLFFSAEAPSSAPPQGDGDPLSLQSLLTPVHNFSHQHSVHCYDNSASSTSLLSAGSGGGGLLMFGGSNGEQQLFSSSCSDCLGMYFELSNDGTSHGHDNSAVTTGLAMESFILQDDHHHKAPPPLLASAASLHDHQYGVSTSCSYEETMPLLVNNVKAGGGGGAIGAGGSFFCSYSEEKGSSSPSAAAVSQEGTFMY